MSRRIGPLIVLVAAACSLALALTSCGGAGGGTAGSSTPELDADQGDPVAGGNGRILQPNEPRSLDPAALVNNWGNYGFIGNAIYGTLLVNDPESLEIEYKMAEDFSTTDGGRSFTLRLRPELHFTDGTPLDANAVKFNWDRMRDPALGTSAAQSAVQIADNEVVDTRTLKVTLAETNPHFGQAIATSPLNWIGSPTALAQDRAAYDAAPVGAGPFMLTEWTRQDSIELSKNPAYWDAPKPYLDTITLRSSPDTTQRFNTVSTGGADFTVETNWQTVAKAEEAGLPTQAVELGGGSYLAMNFARAPFDDPRARRAVMLATDVDALDLAVYDGKAQVPETMFPKSSPYYSDIPLQKYDKDEAQKLFDELAAEGKPVSFTFTSYQAPDAKAAAEALQAQLSAFDNVEVQVSIVESTALLVLQSKGDFDMLVGGGSVQDPDSKFTNLFQSGSPGNVQGIDDPDLDRALQAGRIAESVEDRRAAYDAVQKRLVELDVGTFYSRLVPVSVTGKNVHGVEMYGLGSTLPEQLWIS
ncbi:ABC transporter substrate-binding protein [Rhodococcoides yunnanense]|uniref:ABC transporter substrate-binding protein n=1 Tax=Rhodococcoides yunnanense TaxID=278209 RepID=UPI000935383C|nr:ABC transporter substrate-binding protein [Rhodococcus yunnanensis]